MASPTQPAFDLVSTYVQLEDGPGAVPVEVGDDFWEKSASPVDLDEGRLVCAFHNTNTWPTWPKPNKCDTWGSKDHRWDD